MIAIIDYGMGNLRSVQKGIEHAGGKAEIVSDPKRLKDAERVVLPGVGAFRDCIRNLEQGGFIDPICRGIEQGKLFLGICLGMQLLFTESEEFGVHKGLDLIPGRVTRFPAGMTEGGEKLPIPHIGWNRISICGNHPLFNKVSDGSHLYFVHSYHVTPCSQNVISASCRYGIRFTAAVCSGNIMATQFHPEKSQLVGLQILKNFTDMPE